MQPHALLALILALPFAAGQATQPTVVGGSTRYIIGSSVADSASSVADSASSVASSIIDRVTSTPTSGAGSGAGGVASPPTGGSGADILRVGVGMAVGVGIVGAMAVF